MKNTFIGINRGTAEKVNDLIKTRIPIETTMIELIKRLD